MRREGGGLVVQRSVGRGREFAEGGDKAKGGGRVISHPNMLGD